MTDPRPMSEGAAQNTDRELWRESDSYYADSIHVTESGGIGINCGGHVFVKPLREWHRLALAERAAPAQPDPGHAAVGKFLRDLYSTMIDPCAEGVISVKEMCAALLRAAEQQRELLAAAPAQPVARVESGPVQFGDDWPGLFLRGDDALHYAMRLREFLAYPVNASIDPFCVTVIRGLAEELAGVDARTCKPTLYAAPASQSRAQPAAQAQPGAWLVELQCNGQCRGWLMGEPEDTHTYFGWTLDANKALRFSRKQDADSFRRRYGFTSTAASSTHLSTEHIWLDAAPPAAQHAQEPDK